MYLLKENDLIKYPINLEDLRKNFPNISFGSILDEDFLNSIGVYTVEKVIPPTGKKSKELSPILINGKYTQNWEIKDYTINELEEIKIRDIKTIKEQAFFLMKDSSWAAISTDGLINVKEWIDYRKELSGILNSTDPRNLLIPPTPQIKFI